MVNSMATSATTASASTTAGDSNAEQRVTDIESIATGTDNDDDIDIIAETTNTTKHLVKTMMMLEQTPTTPANDDEAAMMAATAAPMITNKNVLLCRRLKDARNDGFLRSFNSLPLFVYATSSSTHATSADGVGVVKEAAAAAAAANLHKNDAFELMHGSKHSNTGNAINGINISSNNSCSSNGGGGNSNSNGLRITGNGLGAMECLPLSGSVHSPYVMSTTSQQTTSSTGIGAILPTAVVVGAVGGGITTYPHHLNLNHHHHLLSHHSPYSNNYPLNHSNGHHHIHSEQTKSLQELQHEVGALLEFRDLVIETFPDLKHKMASMTSSTASSAIIGNSVGGNGNGGSGGGGGGSNSVGNPSVSSANTLTGGGMSSTSLASRREWEPGIHLKRKISHKEPSTATTANASPSAGGGAGIVAAAELTSSSLTRSRSNSHSGKKEPKSGENNNGSVVQDSGFSTETSSSKEGHSASSTNGAMTVAIASNRLSCPESDDELLNLLDVIHRKSNRLREEVEQLQNFEREQLQTTTTTTTTNNASSSEAANDDGRGKSTSSSNKSGLNSKTFREHVERLNREDIKQLRRERDRLLDKLAEMEAETLTGRIKAAKMNDQVEELIKLKKDLEEQLKLAMAQKLELSSRVQQLQVQQQQQQQQQSKSSSSSQSDFSSQRNFLSSATTVLSTGSTTSQLLETSGQQQQRRLNTFQPVIIEQQQQHPHQLHELLNAVASTDDHLAFHQSSSSDSKKQQQQQQQQQPLGRLDGIVSTPGTRNSKCRVTDSKRFSAILLETNVLELQRHLLTLTVQNQVLMQKLESSAKSKTHLVKRLDKTKEDVEDLRFQLEEKNIELEGTKAQLRVLESRMHSSTPMTNSYLHSQNDYETNRSSASTTLMLSRRGGGTTNSSVAGDSTNFSVMVDSRSTTPVLSGATAPSLALAAPQPTTQISTPSMKAMVHLPMDEIQHHSSSTESAHEHDMALESSGVGVKSKQTPAVIVGHLMSTSIGGVSPFELSTTRGQQNVVAFKKFGNSSKPSKIPLPGSKAAAYFSGKPPTGRPISTAGRSPPSANTSSTSYGSSKSSLSRSTGNLLYGKSPNSLKRVDSAQSIRKDTSNNSLSTNTSRSSTSSSIPLATTPYSSSNAGNSLHKTQQQQVGSTPSPRVLQNSPLPKLKRESLTSRVRHLDSLSRAQQHQQNQHHLSTSANTLSNDSTYGGGQANSPNGSYMVSSTPKPSAIAAQLNATLRKDMQNMSSSLSTSHQQHGSQPFLRRVNGGGGVGNNASNINNSERNQSVTRRFSSASVAGARLAREQQTAAAAVAASHELNAAHSNNSNSSNSGGGISNGNGGHFASDSDSGKSSVNHLMNKSNQYLHLWHSIDDNNHHHNSNWIESSSTTAVSVPERKLHLNKFKQSHLHHHDDDVISELDESEETAYYSNYTQDDDDESMVEDYASDNLLVTFDYGYTSDSVDGSKQHLNHSFNEYAASDEMHDEEKAIIEIVGVNIDDEECDDDNSPIWFNATLQENNEVAAALNAELAASAFRVHHVQHKELTGVSGFNSLLTLSSSSLLEYIVDNDVDDYNDDDEFVVQESYEANESDDNGDDHIKYEDGDDDGLDDDEEHFYDSLESINTFILKPNPSAVNNLS